MSDDVISCPHCGQQSPRNAKVKYCSFCYARFPEMADESPTSEALPVATQTSTAAPSPSEPQATAAPAEAKPVAVAATEALPPPPKAIDYTTVICPFCMAEVDHEAELCPQCQRDLKTSWL